MINENKFYSSESSTIISTKKPPIIQINNPDIIKIDNKIKSHKRIIDTSKLLLDYDLNEINQLKKSIDNLIINKEKMRKETHTKKDLIESLSGERQQIKKEIKTLKVEIQELLKIQENKQIELVNLISKRETSEELMLTYLSKAKDKDFTLFEISFAIDISTAKSFENLWNNNYRYK